MEGQTDGGADSYCGLMPNLKTLVHILKVRWFLLQIRHWFCENKPGCAIFIIDKVLIWIN